MVNDLASVGGAQTIMLQFAEVLIKAGFSVHIASPPGYLAEDGQALGAQWHDFHYSERRLMTPSWRVPRPRAAAARIAEGRRLAALATEVGADIVHTGALIPHVDAQAAWPRFKARTIWSVNQLHPNYLFAGPLPDKIISVSRAALRPALWRPGVVRRSAIVPNSVDLDRFRPPSAAERARVRDVLGLGDLFTVITVARLEPLKGVDTLISALAQSRVKPTLVVVGDPTGFSGGPEYAAGLKTLATDLHVDARFLGNRSDVNELLWAADVFGFASRWDAAPLVLAEASASGLPVITSNVGGCPEIVTDGSTGVVLDPEDVAGFAAAIDQMADDPDLRSRLAVAGGMRVAEEFDAARLGERLLPHYLELARTR